MIASRIEKVYQNQKSSELQKGCSTKSFGTVRRKVFDKVAVASLPERKFGTRKFLKHWNVPLRNVSALWVKKIKKKRDTPSYWKRYPEPEVFSNIEVFLCEKIQYSETKTFRQNRDSFSSWRKFQNQKILKQRRYPQRNVSALWHKKVDKILIPQPIEKAFQNQKFVEPKNGISTNCFVTVGQKIFNAKSWYRAFFPLNLSITETFWNTEGFFYKKFRHSETKRFRQNRDTFSSWKKLWEPEVFWNKGGILIELFQHCGTKNI